MIKNTCVNGGDEEITIYLRNHAGDLGVKNCGQKKCIIIGGDYCDYITLGAGEVAEFVERQGKWLLARRWSKRS